MDRSDPAGRLVVHEDDLDGYRVRRYRPRIEGLTGESWQLAVTPGLVTRIFGGRVTGDELIEGGYVQLPGHRGWWAPTGRVFLSAGDADTPAQERAEASGHFHLTRRAVDPFGAVARVRYEFDLVPVETVDPAGNVTTAEIDYRVL